MSFSMPVLFESCTAASRYCPARSGSHATVTVEASVRFTVRKTSACPRRIFLLMQSRTVCSRKARFRGSLTVIDCLQVDGYVPSVPLNLSASASCHTPHAVLTSFRSSGLYHLPSCLATSPCPVITLLNCQSGVHLVRIPGLPGTIHPAVCSSMDAAGVEVHMAQASAGSAPY